MKFWLKERGAGARKWRWLWSVILAIIFSALTIWLSFRGIRLVQLKQAFRGVNYIWILLATGNSLLTVYALGWRWRQLLNPRARLSLGALFRLNILAQYANILAPARLGELLRLYLTSKESRAEAGFVLGTMAAERILDVVVFVTGALFLSSYFALRSEISLPLSLILGAAGLAGLVVLITFKPALFITILAKALFFLPQKWRRPLLDFVQKGLEAFVYFKSPGRTIFILILTLLLILSQALTNYLVFLAFNLKLSFIAAVMIILAIQAGSLPPAAPGKIGVFEYAVILALSLFSLPREQALSYALMLHVVAYLPKIVLGGFYLARLPAGSALKGNLKTG
jgi:uncharacterized protein (TIRG00374 family)